MRKDNTTRSQRIARAKRGVKNAKRKAASRKNKWANNEAKKKLREEKINQFNSYMRALWEAQQENQQSEPQGE